MIDVNLRAIHLTKMNIKENKVNNCNAFVSNVYENIDKKYDFIITNPPIRAGKDIVYKIYKNGNTDENNKEVTDNDVLLFHKV